MNEWKDMMDSTFDLVWIDGMAWRPDGIVDRNVRVLDTPTGRWLATATRVSLEITPLTHDCGDPPVVDTYVMPTGRVANRIPRLTAALHSLGTVARVRTPLWEAIVSGICRQDAFAPKAAYAQLCGLAEAIKLSLDPGPARYRPCPTPELVLSKSVSVLTAMGTDGRPNTLHIAAEQYLAQADKWSVASSTELLDDLAEIDGLAADTARRIVVDYSGDFSLLPHDVEFRGWATRAARLVGLPVRQGSFARYWQGLTEQHESTMTALLVVWAGEQ